MHHRGQQTRVARFLISGIVIFMAVYVGIEFVSTLRRLDIIEADRDQWQRPSDVLRALDLGSGAGYFALKLASLVGERGEVHAVDIRRLSLFFLRMRAFRRNLGNLRIIVGNRDHPHLAAERADAVLICNTYHELANPQVMLRHSFAALRSGGRLVMLERSAVRDEIDSLHHTTPLTQVEQDLLRAGFTILNRDASFIEQSKEDIWWLLVARRP